MNIKNTCFSSGSKHLALGLQGQLVSLVETRLDIYVYSYAYMSSRGAYAYMQQLGGSSC